MADSGITDERVKVTEIEGKGRGMVVSESVKAGEILLRDSPILVYSAVPLTNGIFSKYCSYCFRILRPTSSACSSCSYHALFCNPNCRSLALSSSHSNWVCQALNCLRYDRSPVLFDPEARVQAYFLIAAYNLANVSPSKFQLLLSLEGESHSVSPPLPDKTLALHSLIASLYPPQSFAGCSPMLTAALLAKDKLNAFGLMEPFQASGERKVRAYAIYSKASFFNHDCLPNACRFDYVDAAGDRNTDIIVRAIHDIPQGREICLSYFPVDCNYADRQRRLMDDYGFNCECDRCKVEANWSDVDDDDNCECDQCKGVANLTDDGDHHPRNMEEDEVEQMAVSMDENDPLGDDEFPHAYFFLRYLCDRDNCAGTLAPLPPSEGTLSNVMECNACGRLKTTE